MQRYIYRQILFHPISQRAISPTKRYLLNFILHFIIGIQLPPETTNPNLIRCYPTTPSYSRDPLRSPLLDAYHVANVRPHVDAQMRQLRGRVVADAALERLLAAVVRAHVNVQVGLLRGGIAAYVALVRLVARVEARVLHQPGVGGGLVRALRALVRSLARVRAHVHLEVGFL